MTIVRVGSTSKYSQGWETAFGKGRKMAAAAASASKSKAKTGGRKQAAKKRKK